MSRRRWDDTPIGLAQLYSSGLGGVKLLTDIDDADDARELLDRYRKRGRKKRKQRRKSADEVARRAFRTAVIGIFLCPGALHLYVLVVVASLDRARLTRSGKRNALAAAVVSCGVIVALLLVLVSSC